MAGIEQLESYIVRWVKVDEGNTLSWSVQPHKKSINFGLVKHPGSGATTIASSITDSLDTEETRGTSETKTSRFSKKDVSAQDLLKNKGFIAVKWVGKCEADKVSIGTYEVQHGHSGMYGLVFDNTFSKQTSKTATFVVLTYPTGAPPQTSSHLPNLQTPKAGLSQTSLGRYSAVNLHGDPSASYDSLHSHKAGGKATSVSGRSEGGTGSSNYHVGSLHKRRRKKGQGYARRFFSLDFSTCTLSYYYNPKSSALRGAIPLSLAAIAADERRREISIDSGAEVWHLKAPNDKEFQEWARALERASRVARGLETLDHPSQPDIKVTTTHLQPVQQSSHHEHREWQQVEALVSRVVGTRDALRRLTREVTAHAINSKTSNSPQYLSPSSGSAIEEGDASTAPERKKFWRRKSTTPGTIPGLAPGANPATAFVASPPTSVTTTISADGPQKLSRHRSRASVQEESSLQDHCQSLLADLDSVVAEFTALINNSKRRRLPVPTPSVAESRRSIDTVSTADEFFDAEDTRSGVVKIDGSEEETPGSDGDDGSMHDDSSISSIAEDEPVVEDAQNLYPAKPKTLTPLPIDKPIARRTTVPAATVPPPSLIAFVRKNVGKDLSTISMPVSANEPLSGLQKMAEQLEYAQLLNQASKQSSPTDRLLFVAAFAVSQFSGVRAKERAVRKPFNPLLGETFELVRSEKEIPGGFRLLVEKVSHRPVVLAMHADSASWSFSQSPAPGQKFWGKSAEITTDGRVRIVLRLSDGREERYSWNIATMFLRNVVMGEKYVEPVGTMHVLNDSSGHKAAVEFKSKGMFGGRAEDVVVEILSPEGVNTGTGLVGNWTTGLKTSGRGGGQDIWRAGSLVENASQTYGFTSFAATLNEITEIEKGKLPPTDCRLRPDQRLTEQGKLDEAEEWKHGLEEAQRARRRDLEDRGEMYKPRWFVKAEDAPEGEEVWKFKSGKESYWEERTKGAWTGVEDIFLLPDGP
ncbi:Oxysterol-binding protein-domain-containing protein [Mariannaea sp. PMI_226]|nr:Oxysterol-binding protein-domain-containing protein [Mariannaea sp. PMI_226]